MCMVGSKQSRPHHHRIQISTQRKDMNNSRFHDDF